MPTVPQHDYLATDFPSYPADGYDFSHPSFDEVLSDAMRSDGADPETGEQVS